jgi:hypothetical protein
VRLMTEIFDKLVVLNELVASMNLITKIIGLISLFEEN